ncbi:unnamed protein product, partial [Discosporangium mesarthrocarpum]
NVFVIPHDQGPQFYPGTGWPSEQGCAANVVNVFLRGGEGSDPFRRAYEDRILPALKEFNPGIIIISAGKHGRKQEGARVVDDPLAEIKLDAEDYYWVTKNICELAAEVACGARVVSILEGGYSLDAISSSAVRHVCALQEAAAAT